MCMKRCERHDLAGVYQMRQNTYLFSLYFNFSEYSNKNVEDGDVWCMYLVHVAKLVNDAEAIMNLS